MNLPDPTFDGTTHEWPVGTYLYVGATHATLYFTAQLAPTTGLQTATGQAWVGNTAVDVTTILGDSVPATAAVTVNP